MPSRKWKIKFLLKIVAAPLLLLGLWLGLSDWRHANPVRQKVWELIDPNGPASSLYRTRITIVKMVNGKVVPQMPNSKASGPQIDPYLTIKDYIAQHGSEVFTYLNEFASHRESSLLGFYRVNYPRIPGWLQSKLPAPLPPDQIALHGFELINRLGPVAARACAESVIEGVNHPVGQVQYAAIQAFWYVFPGSETALNKVLDEIKNGNQALFSAGIHRPMMEWQWSQDFTQKLQITNGLAHVTLADDIFYTLDQMGEEAVPVIPVVMDKMKELDQLDNNGSLTRSLTAERFRRLCVSFLSKYAGERFGVTEFLLNYVGDWDPVVRAKTGKLLVEKAAYSPELVPKVLASLLDADLNAWVVKMRAIGLMGERAMEMLPTLVRFTSEDYIKTWYEELEAPYKKTLSLTHLKNMKMAACVAVGRIDPEKVEAHLPYLVQAIGLHEDPVVFLKETTELSDAIIPLVEPYLQSPVDKKRKIAADILVCHDSSHSDALSTLHRFNQMEDKYMKAKLLQHEEPQLLSSESMLNWENGASVSTVRKELKGNEEQQNLLALIEYGLTSGQPGDVLASIHLLMDMEDKPEQFIPLVKEVLKPERPETCFSAFYLLLDYGIEHLPPLRE